MAFNYSLEKCPGPYQGLQDPAWSSPGNVSCLLWFGCTGHVCELPGPGTRQVFRKCPLSDEYLAFHLPFDTNPGAARMSSARKDAQEMVWLALLSQLPAFQTAAWMLNRDPSQTESV